MARKRYLSIYFECVEFFLSVESNKSDSEEETSVTPSKSTPKSTPKKSTLKYVNRLIMYRIIRKEEPRSRFRRVFPLD